METLPQTKDKNEVAHYTNADMGIHSEDLEYPKLLLMQPGSPQVADGKAKLGDIFDTARDTVIGGAKPIELIPLRTFKTLKTYDLSQNPRKLVKQEDWTPAMSIAQKARKLPRECFPTLNFYFLMKADMGAGSMLPYFVWFQSSSYRSGVAVTSQMANMQFFKKPPHARSILLSTTKMKKDNQQWAIYQVANGNMLTDQEIVIASSFLAGLKSTAPSSADDYVSEPTEAEIVPPTQQTSGTREIY